MRHFFSLVTVVSLLVLANYASAFPGRPGPGPGPFPGGGGHEGPGGRRGEIVNNPNLNGYFLMAGGNADRNARQFCFERGSRRGGRVLSTQWTVRAPASNFNGRSWDYFPQADNYMAVSSVECFDRGGGGGGVPYQIFNPPLIQNYAVAASQEAADAFCQLNQGWHGQIQQTTYVDTAPAYSFSNGQWVFSPRADHYYMIQTLACYR